MRTCSVHPQVEPEISRFPCKELLHMPGSATTPGWAGTRAGAPLHFAFRDYEHVGTRDFQAFAAQWLAYVLPYRCFADTLAGANARLGADADRYSFTVVDLHLLLFAGFDRRTKNLDLCTGRIALGLATGHADWVLTLGPRRWRAAAGPARTSPGGPQFRPRRFPALLIAVAAPAAASPALLHPRQVDQRAGRALVGRHRRPAAKVHHAICNSSAACIVSTGSEGAGRKASR
jgi:hypothetical protein